MLYIQFIDSLILTKVQNNKKQFARSYRAAIIFQLSYLKDTLCFFFKFFNTMSAIAYSENFHRCFGKCLTHELPTYNTYETIYLPEKKIK